MKRIHIARLELDIRGVTAKTAQDTAQSLGPALARAIGGRQIASMDSATVDAGRISLSQPLAAPALATWIAAQVASRFEKG